MSTTAITFNYDNSLLFPNNTAKPIKADFSITLWRDWHILGGISYAFIGYNGVEKDAMNNSSQNPKTQVANNDTSADVIDHNATNTKIFLALAGSHSFFTARSDATVTLYFTRYDFSATVGSGVTSASASSSNGYDGDTVTFTASVQNGYTWDGWYNGTTKVSSSQTYVHTVNGADLSLTAKAIASTKQLTVTYGGNTIVNTQVTPPVGITYDNTQIASVSSGQTKTLNCSNKLMSSNVIIGAGGVLSSALGKLWRRISWWLSANPKGGELI